MYSIQNRVNIAKITEYVGSCPPKNVEASTYGAKLPGWKS